MHPKYFPSRARPCRSSQQDRVDCAEVERLVHVGVGLQANKRHGNMFEILGLLVLSPLAVYFLTILLRVSCHFCGVDIPAIGRALFTTFLSAFLSLIAGVAFQSAFVGLDPKRVS